MIRTTNIKAGRLDLSEVKYVDEKTYKIWTRRAVPQVGDVLLTREAPLGEVAIVRDEERTFLGQRVMLYRADHSVLDPRFLFYSVRGPYLQRQIHAHSGSGSTVDHIRVPDCSKFELPLPPLPEQRAIAHILGTLDDKIELNRRMNATLEAMARALFQSWFVDFDPVRAKAEGRQPAGMDAATAALFPDAFEESALGAVPVGWRARRVSELADINASTLRRSEPLEVIDYIEISEVMRGEIGSVTRYMRGTEPSRARRKLRHGDTVISTVRPDRGAYFLCLCPSETLIASTGFAVVSPRDGNWAFLYAALTRQEVGEELGRRADGGAYPAIRPEAVGELTLTVPSQSDLVSIFQQLVAPELDRVHQNRIEGQTLTTLRDALLPKLLSGEVRVSEANQAMGAAI
jgi:type I restriction enzyme S subunit